MSNKNFITGLTIIITILCLYYLSFSLISRKVQGEATDYTRNLDGSVNQLKKQKYLDSVWNLPVFNLLGVEFTYKEIKETELNLGLDLQGGMHVTLEISPIDIIKGLSRDSQNPAFLKSLEEAKNSIKGTGLNFIDEFYKAFQKNAPNQKLNYIFANATNRGKITLQTTDEEILKIINDEVENAIGRSFNILRTRIDKFGTSQPNIQRLAGTGRIQIELPGVDNPQRVRKLLQSAARLDFFEVLEIGEKDLVSTLNNINKLLLSQENIEKSSSSVKKDSLVGTPSQNSLESLLLDPTAKSEKDTASLVSQLQQDSSNLNTGEASLLLRLLKSNQGGLMYSPKDVATISQLLEKPEVKNLIPSTIKFLWASKPFSPRGGTSTEEEFIELYPIKTLRGGTSKLSGEAIADAQQDFDQNARPSIAMQMNANGTKIWRKMTAENTGRRIAIVLDNYVYSAPTVQGEIPSGNSSITGNFTLEEAKDLANVLKAGTLPAPTTIVEDVVIGPTLGKEAQIQGIVSTIAGLMSVVIFMIMYYAKGGIIANIALLFNIFFILGVLAQFSAALTLPGIAGIVLTMGMSVDANVLIFERIREELRNGSTFKTSITIGYNKAFSAIFDSNATTFIIGMILYNFGQGPVKGFAITLMIGIVSSFFTAVFITRVIINFLYSKRKENSNITFETGLFKNFLIGISYKFIENRRKAYLFSLTFIVIGFIALFAKGGLNMGVDFTGGRSYIVIFNTPVVTSDIKVGLGEVFGKAGTEVKTYGSDNIIKITTSYLINDDSEETDGKVTQTLIAGLEKITKKKYIENESLLDNNSFSIGSGSRVSGTIADDIKKSSVISIVVSLIAIFLYILIRFRRAEFGLGATIALFHDVLFVIAAFAIVNVFGITYEIDQVFIAAILTLIGYSINDTVVVFDRIREKIGMRKEYEQVSTINHAINDTLSRTVITSSTTFLTVLVLFLFGGDVLKSFSFTLLVGIVIGTYSSIFIAAPIVIDFKRKNK
ncbi:MAG: protein translocase subunit SecDF [Chitinophagaceae bacterium]|nr:protein translocase subunit SecDF [Chitinophagaceae bacterium]